MYRLEEWQAAQEVAREIVTLIKMADGQEHEDALISGVVQERMRAYMPRQSWLLVEVLARAVAATYEDLADWSASVVQAVAQEDDA